MAITPSSFDKSSSISRRNTIGSMLMATISILSMVASLGTDIFIPSFPEVAQQLHASEASVQLTLTLFMLGMGAGQLFWGPLSDHRGRRWPLLVACMIFVLSSAAAPLSDSIATLVIARFIQGFSGSAGAVLGRALARDLASGTALAQVFSLLGIVTGVSPVAAPVVGGLLARPVGWRGVLWLLAAIALLMLLLSAVTVHESLPPKRRQRGGLRDIAISITVVCSDRAFVGYVLIQGFVMGSLYAFISSSSFVLQKQYGLSSLVYSLVFALNAVALIVGGTLNSLLVRHVDMRRILAFSLAASAIIVVALTAVTLTAGASGTAPALAALMALVWIISLLNSPMMATTTTLALQRHPDDAGMASALLGAVSFVCSGIVAQLVSITGSANVTSMVLVMSAALLLAGIIYLAVCRKANPITQIVEVDEP